MQEKEDVLPQRDQLVQRSEREESRVGRRRAGKGSGEVQYASHAADYARHDAHSIQRKAVLLFLRVDDNSAQVCSLLFPTAEVAHLR
jgi:hypothetical protein